MLTMGLDIGSTACKCIILEDGKNILGRAVVSSGAGTVGVKSIIMCKMPGSNLTAI